MMHLWVTTPQTGAQETSIAQEMKEMLNNPVELIQTIPISYHTAQPGVHIKRSQHVAAQVAQAHKRESLLPNKVICKGLLPHVK